jgi:hypothetical protein
MDSSNNDTTTTDSSNNDTTTDSQTTTPPPQTPQRHHHHRTLKQRHHHRLSNNDTTRLSNNDTTTTDSSNNDTNHRLIKQRHHNTDSSNNDTIQTHQTTTPQPQYKDPTLFNRYFYNNNTCNRRPFAGPDRQLDSGKPLCACVQQRRTIAGRANTRQRMASTTYGRTKRAGKRYRTAASYRCLTPHSGQNALYHFRRC